MKRLHNPLIIPLASAASAAASQCADAIRAMLPWARDYDRARAIKDSLPVYGPGEAPALTSPQRAAEVAAASRAAHAAYVRLERQFVAPLDPINRVVVGAEASPFGGGAEPVRLYDLRREAFRLAVLSVFRPDWTAMDTGRPIQAVLLGQLVALAGATDYAAQTYYY